MATTCWYWPDLSPLSQSWPRERLQSYRQLQRELKRLAMKQDARLRSEARKQRAAFARSLRKTSW